MRLVRQVPHQSCALGIRTSNHPFHTYIWSTCKCVRVLALSRVILFAKFINSTRVGCSNRLRLGTQQTRFGQNTRVPCPCPCSHSHQHSRLGSTRLASRSQKYLLPHSPENIYRLEGFYV